MFAGKLNTGVSKHSLFPIKNLLFINCMNSPCRLSSKSVSSLAAQIAQDASKQGYHFFGFCLLTVFFSVTLTQCLQRNEQSTPPWLPQDKRLQTEERAIYTKGRRRKCKTESSQWPFGVERTQSRICFLAKTGIIH